ncbi:hypothetical protein CO662_06905 [Rhizobium anhuiense]|uniref:D,D-heptose 1,7-bisphosphate phosphatase n=1 Tax=Rhizobium anhuiense TaxID=1184720 RepID=A0ABX4JDX8_9HYPH|nr:HAD-IIIA family hydrolase [Rhizobium anhuiense]PDS45818.1 hypothetical protein CO668_04630 [Rhizobium anhuiense]PDS53232.1 hypothetical protein CO662_06905 [Rhizobium anhuiense]PDS65808.1 hypothetical protein CO653_08415 [Rhizobium anhuiense]
MLKPLAGYKRQEYEKFHSRIYWRRERQSRPRQEILFLDRDGVLNVDSGYVGSIRQVELLPGVINAIQFCRRSGIFVALVTNQSGIGRKYYSWADFELVCHHIEQSISKDAPMFEAIAACAQVPNPDLVEEFEWRKPGPGMIQAICDRLELRADRCWLVGDRLSDVEAAARAGLAGAVQISDPRSKRASPASTGFSHLYADEAADAIALAASSILRQRDLRDRKVYE